MKPEELETKLGTELFAKVKAAIGDEEILVAPKGQFIPKARLDEVIADRDTFKTKNTELETKIQTLSDGSKGIEDITKERDGLRTQLQEVGAKHTKDLIGIKLEHLVETKHPKDIKLVLPHIDQSKLTLDEKGQLQGAVEQIEPFVKDHSYLFETTLPGAVGSQTPPAHPDSLEETLEKWKKL